MNKQESEWGWDTTFQRSEHGMSDHVIRITLEKKYQKTEKTKQQTKQSATEAVS